MILIIVIIAGLGVLSLRRALNLGTSRVLPSSCSLSLPETDDVLMAPPMISHPLASDVRLPRHLAPTVGPSAASAGVVFQTGTTLPSGERIATGFINQPDAFACACTSASPGAGVVFPASYLVDLFRKLSLSDAVATEREPFAP